MLTYTGELVASFFCVKLHLRKKIQNQDRALPRYYLTHIDGHTSGVNFEFLALFK